MEKKEKIPDFAPGLAKANKLKNVLKQISPDKPTKKKEKKGAKVAGAEKKGIKKRSDFKTKF